MKSLRTLKILPDPRLSGVPNPWGYICPSEVVHLRLAVEGKIYLYIIYFQIFIHCLYQ